MSERTDHPVGAPCRWTCFSPHPERATAFYTELLGWAEVPASMAALSAILSAA